MILIFLYEPMIKGYISKRAWDCEHWKPAFGLVEKNQ
jgi:hypothetical protein